VPISSIEIISHLLGKEFGIAPWEILNSNVEDVLKAWALYCEMQPRGK
jgi:hypothetical protein